LRETSRGLQDLFPDSQSQLPSLDDRPAFKGFDNPYLENHAAVTERHPCLKASRFDANVINGYLKFAMSFSDHDCSEELHRGGMHVFNDTILASGATSRKGNAANATSLAILRRQIQALPPQHEENVSRLPSGFGSNAKIDAIDRKILRFCMFF
jgi:hypothetical protein